MVRGGKEQGDSDSKISEEKLEDAEKKEKGTRGEQTKNKAEEELEDEKQREKKKGSKGKNRSKGE